MMLGIDLGGRVAAIIGGGEVAGRKAQSLLEAGAKVRVISPEIGRTIRTYLDQGLLHVVARTFHPEDTEGAWLVVAATGRLEVDGAIAAEVKGRGGLVCVTGWPDLGNLHFPAELRRGPITVGVTTGGASPALARLLSRSIAQWIGPEYGRLADLLSELRTQVKASGGSTQSERSRFFTSLLDGPLLELLKNQDDDQVRTLIAQALHDHFGTRPELDNRD